MRANSHSGIVYSPYVAPAVASSMPWDPLYAIYNSNVGHHARHDIPGAEVFPVLAHTPVPAPYVPSQQTPGSPQIIPSPAASPFEHGKSPLRRHSVIANYTSPEVAAYQHHGSHSRDHGHHAITPPAGTSPIMGPEDDGAGRLSASPGILRTCSPLRSRSLSLQPGHDSAAASALFAAGLFSRPLADKMDDIQGSLLDWLNNSPA